jgi:hypothetical protein
MKRETFEGYIYICQDFQQDKGREPEEAIAFIRYISIFPSTEIL